MIGSESIRYALRNIAHRKGRSFLTVLSIFLGIATIFIFVSFGLGLYGYMNDLLEGGSGDKIMVQPKGSMGVPGLDSTFALTDNDVEVVSRAGGIYEATGSVFKIAEVESRDELKYVFLLSYDPSIPILMDLYDVDVKEGRWLRKGDSGKVLLGYNYLIDDKIFSKGLKINDKITVQDKELRIVGFMESVGNPQDDSQVYVINDYVDEIYPNDSNSYGWIVARADKDNIDWAVENVERGLRNSRDMEEGKEDFSVESFTDMIESFSTAMDIIIGFVVLIALISVVVSAVNTANTMITSVIERTKEIGVIKSIGGTNSEVFGIFLFEAGFLGFVAGVIGVLLGWGAAALGGYILDKGFYLVLFGREFGFGGGWGFLAPVFPGYLFGGLIVFAVLTGAISGAIPAWNASRTNIVDALRYE
ncbi:ABC transporter permease [Candidatus Pacearchaeota archaeon]|nr:ABC transporter permease [Candidatus Pacearchaeota archaeon]